MNRRSVRARSLTIAILACIAACASPTSPSLPMAPPIPEATDFIGEWVGTNSHGAPVSFTVSGDQVMSFTLSLSVQPSCSGTETLQGPSQIALRPDNQQGFVLGRLERDGADWTWAIALYGVFSADRRSASGRIQTTRYRGCGTIGLDWTAQRR